MTSKRSLRSEDEDGFLRAFRDELLDTALMYGVTVTTDLRLGKTAGAIVFHLRAEGNEGGPMEGTTTHAECLYPSRTATRLHAALYQAGIRLNVAVQHAYRDTHGHYYSDPV